MKRLLLENIKAIPYTLTQPINRLGALSGVLGIQILTADPDTVASITVTHCDSETGTYSPVLDERIFLDNTHVARDSTGKMLSAFTAVSVTAGELLNIDIDLIGCEQFIKIGVEFTSGGSPASATATYALALGDFNRAPPEA